MGWLVAVWLAVCSVVFLVVCCLLVVGWCGWVLWYRVCLGVIGLSCYLVRFDIVFDGNFVVGVGGCCDFGHLGVCQCPVSWVVVCVRLRLCGFVLFVVSATF